MEDTGFLVNIFPESEYAQEELDLIFSKFKKVSFKKNEFLLREGKIENHYWFLENGLVRSFVNDTEGKDITTNFYGRGDIVIDWSSFFLRNPTRENIQALTECNCWQLDFTSFQELFHGIEAFREQGRKRLVSSYFELKNQSISLIAEDAKVRYLRLLEEKPQIIQNIPLQHIATFLGITKYSLSRIRKEISQ